MKTVTVIPFKPGLRDLHEELLDDFVRILHENVSPDFWCLDLGTGEGRVAFELSPHVRWILGIDRQARRIEAARRRAQNEGITNVQFIVSDLDHIHYDDFAPTGTFQLVTTNLCLSDDIISRLPEAMAEGSTIVGTCFELNHWRETGRPSGFAYSENHLMTVLRANGFELINLDVIGRVMQFESLEQLTDEYLPGRLIEKWRSNGRWKHLESQFATGNRTLTDSKIIFSARLS